MGRTRLFQAPGSPLIQGQSRLRRSFAADWSAALAFTLAILLAYLLMRAILGAPELSWTIAISEMLSVADVAIAISSAVALSVLGVWFGRHMGWFKPWYAGAMVGTVAGVLVFEVTARIAM